jgi:K+-transporting ATPase ATPase C chain
MNRLPVIVRQHIAAFRALLVFTVLCGLVYPAVMVGISQGLFPHQANGSMVSVNGRTASNLGPNNPDLVKLIKQRQQAIAAFDHVRVSQIPPDAVTASGSGLDPGISPQNAAIQVDRVAAARNLPVSTVKSLVATYTQGRTLGFLGEPAVNVLELNIALDQLPAKSSG